MTRAANREPLFLFFAGRADQPPGQPPGTPQHATPIVCQAGQGLARPFDANLAIQVRLNTVDSSPGAQTQCFPPLGRKVQGWRKQEKSLQRRARVV
jgi:hypothetical protein